LLQRPLHNSPKRHATAAGLVVSPNLAKNEAVRLVLVRPTLALCVFKPAATPSVTIIAKSRTVSDMYQFEGHAQEVDSLMFLGDSDASAVELNQLEQRNIKNILVAGMGLMKYHPEDKVRLNNSKLILSLANTPPTVF
jgi:hypothetical protein